jgi:hypothetical protein
MASPEVLLGPQDVAGQVGDAAAETERGHGQQQR